MSAPADETHDAARNRPPRPCDHDWIPFKDGFKKVACGIEIVVQDTGRDWFFEGRTAHGVYTEPPFETCAEAKDRAEAWALDQTTTT